MSAEQFSKLSLEESMVTTRAGAAKARRSGSGSQTDQDQDQPQQSIETPSPTSPTPSLVISTTNLRYNVSGFGADLRRRVKNGMEGNDIKMKYCTFSSDEDVDGVVQFYVDDDINVAIGGKLPKPKCSCGANERGKTCKHIYWLVDQILSTNQESYEEQSPLQLSPDGSAVQNVSSPVDVLKNKGLDHVAENLKWAVKKEELPEDDDEMKDDVANMLSVFEPQEALPGEFRCPGSPLMSERSRKYQEFAKVLTEYAQRDPGLFIRMRDIIDPNFQCRVFFEKIDSRIARTFHALDEYIAHGTMDAAPDAIRIDVPNCARQLNDLVSAIDEFCRGQDGDDQQTRDVASRAAAALVSILDRVVARNVNAYAGITWGLEAPDNPLENNLFVALIGSHKDNEPAFVLDTLRALPQEDVLRVHWEKLQAIEQQLPDYGTPPAYLNTFRRVVHDSRKRAASEIREGEAKRTMQD